MIQLNFCSSDRYVYFIQVKHPLNRPFKPSKRSKYESDHFVKTNRVLLVSSASTPGLWQSLATVLGDDSFNDANEKQRWATLCASGSRFGEALKAEWQRLQQLRTEAMAAAGAQDATKSILDADHNSFGHGTSKFHKRVFDEIGGLERDAVTRRAEELTRDDPRRMAFLASGDCKFSNQLLLGTPIEALRLTAREFRSAVQNKFGVPQSRCLPIAGRPITNHAKNPSLRVDVYGHFLKTVTGAKYDVTGSCTTKS